jgi:hypothetical protein
MAFDPAIFSVCLFLLGTTVLTWCLGTAPLVRINGLTDQRCGRRQLSRGVVYRILDGVSTLVVGEEKVDV